MPVGARSGKKLNGIADSSNVHVTVTVAFTATVAGAVIVAAYARIGTDTTVLGGPSVTGTALGVAPRRSAMPDSAAVARAGSAVVLVRTRYVPEDVTKLKRDARSAGTTPVSVVGVVPFGMSIEAVTGSPVTPPVVAIKSPESDTTNRRRLPLLPPLLAVMVTGPRRLVAVTRPNGSSVANSTSDDVKVIGRCSTFPALSLARATSCFGKRGRRRVSAGATNTTLATGTGTTVMEIDVCTAATVIPSAEIVVVPTAIPVTRPVAETVATFGLELANVIARIATAAFDESLPVAVSWALPPTTRGFVGPVSVSEKSDASDATSVSVPTTPSTVAEMIAVPGAMARTAPSLAPTVTAAGLLDVKANVFPVMTTPAEVRAVATTTSERPTRRRDGPVTPTAATTIGGGGGGVTLVVSTGGVSGVSPPQAAKMVRNAADATNERRT